MGAVGYNLVITLVLSLPRYPMLDRWQQLSGWPNKIRFQGFLTYHDMMREDDSVDTIVLVVMFIVVISTGEVKIPKTACLGTKTGLSKTQRGQKRRVATWRGTGGHPHNALITPLMFKGFFPAERLGGSSKANQQPLRRPAPESRSLQCSARIDETRYW